MSNEDEVLPDVAVELEQLRARASTLEAELEVARSSARERLVAAELKLEAVRAGMVDLDGLKLVDHRTIVTGEDGEVEGAAALMAQLKASKPWLFAQGSSSSVATPPPRTTRAKLATEMTLDEWRTARAEMLRRR